MWIIPTSLTDLAVFLILIVTPTIGLYAVRYHFRYICRICDRIALWANLDDLTGEDDQKPIVIVPEYRKVSQSRNNSQMRACITETKR